MLFFFVILLEMYKMFDKTKKYRLLLNNYCYFEITMIEYNSNINVIGGTEYECSVVG